jgi:hypothetical protein
MKLIHLIVLAGVVFGSSTGYGQTPAPKASPSVELQVKVQEQQIKIDGLTKNVELMQRELDVARAEINTDLDKRFWAGYLLGGILTLIGISSVASVYVKFKVAEKNLVKKMEESLVRKINIEVAKRIAKFDPASALLRIPSRGFEDERKSLERFGFKNFELYDKLDESCLSGCVIVPFYNNPQHDSSEADEFRQFLADYNPDPEKVGYMLYITSGTIPPDLRQKFKATDYSTSIITLNNNVLNISRSLVR